MKNSVVKGLFDNHFAENSLRTIYSERIAHSNTIGRDGVHPAAFEAVIDQELALIQMKVAAGKYRFTAFKQRLILKGAKKNPREISIAGVRDRVTLRALTNTLSEIFSDSKQSLPHQYISEIKTYIEPLGDDYSFVQLDVQDFYPSLSHDELLKRLRTQVRFKPLLSLVLSAVRTPTGSDNVSLRGVPQGLSISNVLSSIYMTKIDEDAREKFAYFRYVDDILIICKTTQAHKNLGLMERRLKKVGLDIHPHRPGSKTKIQLLSEGIEYLGYRIAPKSLSVRQSSYKRMMENIMAVLTAAKYKPPARKTLVRLNLKITGCILNEERFGWMFFFSMTQDMRQLRRLDRFIQRLWVKYGFTPLGKPKTFIKTYHEIRFNSAATKYIPKFDVFTNQQKIQMIADIQGLDPLDIQNWTAERLNKTFKRVVKREVSELEKDITAIS